MLALRYKLSRRAPRRPLSKDRFRLARILVAALLLLLAIGYRLQRQIRTLDGQKDYDPSALERIVTTMHP